MKATHRNNSTGLEVYAKYDEEDQCWLVDNGYTDMDAYHEKEFMEDFTPLTTDP